MKTLKFGLLLVFLATPILIFSLYHPQRSSVLRAIVQADAARNQLQIMVNKPSKDTVLLQMLDNHDRIVHEQSLLPGPSVIDITLKLNAIPNGSYRLDVSDSNQVNTTLVELASADDSMLKRQITIQPVSP